MTDTHVPSPRTRMLALAVLCAGMLMIILDGSIVTVALPSIQRDLRFSPADLTWTVNAYLVAFGGLLLLAGRLGDLLGRRNLLVAGLAVFTVASLLCGLAVTKEMLIAARFAQGVGGAMTAAVSLGMIVVLFPEPREQARAMGAFSFVGAAGASIGQVLGGVLTQALSWHWVFLINLPIGLAAGVLALRVLAADRGAGPRTGIDVLGAVLVTAGLMLGVYTMVETTAYGWLSAHTLGLGALALLLLAGFAARQATADMPLLPLRVFRSRNVSGANAIQTLLIAAGFGFQVVLALYLQQVLGFGAAETGLAMLPAAIGIGGSSLFLSARLIARFGPRPVLVGGLALLAAGLGALTQVPSDGGYLTHVLPPMLALAGFGLAQPALMGLGMSDAGEGDAGVVSGLFNTTQQVGAALGVAVLSTLAAARTHHLAATGHRQAEALTSGFHLAFGIASGLLVASALIAVTVLRPAHRPAQAPAPEPAHAS